MVIDSSFTQSVSLLMCNVHACEHAWLHDRCMHARMHMCLQVADIVVCLLGEPLKTMINESRIRTVVSQLDELG